MATALGAVWLLIWAAIARPPFLPKSAHMTSKLAAQLARAPGVGARLQLRACRSPGPVLTISAIYLAQRLQLTQADEQRRVDPTAHLGHRLLLLGMGRRSLRRQQPAAGRHVPAADGSSRSRWGSRR